MEVSGVFMKPSKDFNMNESVAQYSLRLKAARHPVLNELREIVLLEDPATRIERFARWVERYVRLQGCQKKIDGLILRYVRDRKAVETSVSKDAAMSVAIELFPHVLSLKTEVDAETGDKTITAEMMAIDLRGKTE
jgi:hypothetical protein